MKKICGALVVGAFFATTAHAQTDSSDPEDLDPKVQDILDSILSTPPPEDKKIHTRFSSLIEIRKISLSEERLDAYLRFFLSKNPHLCGQEIYRYCNTMKIGHRSKFENEGNINSNTVGLANYLKNEILIRSDQLHDRKTTEQIIAHEIAHLLISRTTVFKTSCETDAAHERLAEYHGMYILLNGGWKPSELTRYYRKYAENFRSFGGIHLSPYEQWNLSRAVVKEIKLKQDSGLGLIPKNHDFCKNYFWIKE